MGSRCKVLVLGYTNYRQYLWNPAEEVVDRINGTEIGDCRVEGRKLPVKLRAVMRDVPRHLNEVDPDIAIGLGLNPIAKDVVLELVSSNLLSFTVEDEEGDVAEFQFIDNGELRALKTGLPVREIYESCVMKRALPLRMSIGIGSYLCNALGYLIMKWSWINNRLGGFIHLPPHTDLALKLGLKNYLSLNDIVETVKCIIEVGGKVIKKPVKV